MKLTQGDTYEESTSKEVPEIEVELPTKTSGSKKWLPYVGVAGLFLLVGLIIISVSVNSSVADEEEPPPVSNEFELDETDFIVFSYAPTEVQALRAVGYTGDEIDYFESQGYDAAIKIAEAEEAIKAKQQELLDQLSDPSNPEYQILLDKTWLGGREFLLNPLPEDNESWYVKSVTYNADYDKLPTHGNQLWIRIHMEDGSYSFMEMTPDRFVKLKDSGNILITYDEITYNGVTFTYNIKEVLTDAR